MAQFFDLTDDEVADFVGEARAFPGLWVFHHVPKTAGSSLAGELASHAAPYCNIVADYTSGEGSHDERMWHAVDDALARHAEVPLRSVSGHLGAAQLGYIRSKVPGSRAFTFLRHPVARLVSEYHYSISPKHPPHAAFRERFPNFQSFIEAPGERNKMSLYLFGTTALDPDEALARLGATYAMIGLQERYPASFLLLSSMIWGAGLPRMRERVGTKPQQALDPALERRILALNQLDLMLYRSVEQVYQRIAETIWGYLRPQIAPQE